MLPSLVVIADRFTDTVVASHAVSAAQAGAPWLMLRDRTASPLVFLQAATGLVTRLREIQPTPLLSLTAQVDAARALQTHLHLGSRDASVEEARRVLSPAARIGYSAHSVAEAERTAPDVDYLFFSPVYETAHRPGVAPSGLEALARAVAAAGPTPVYALGGITVARAAACADAGAHGVAVMSGVMDAPDVAAAVRDYLRALS